MRRMLAPHQKKRLSCNIYCPSKQIHPGFGDRSRPWRDTVAVARSLQPKHVKDSDKNVISLQTMLFMIVIQPVRDITL